MKNTLFFFLACALLFGVQETAAQVTIFQVVTKRIEKTFNYRDGYEVNIEGEKAEVQVETWEKNEIGIQLDLISKHPDKKIAERDLAAIKYLAERIKNKIYVRNYISTEEGAPKPEAHLSAKYIIKLPKDCPVYLKNYFGIAKVSDLSNRLRVNSEFSRIGLQNLKGIIDVKTRFGDLQGRHLDGIMAINSRRSDIVLRDLKGKLDIEAFYGTIELFEFEGISHLNILAEKTDIFLFDSNLQAYGYSLTSNFGKIDYPGDLRFQVLEPSENLKKIEFKPSKEFYPNITITISFGDVHLEKEKKKAKP
jgi:hypothetical protein